MSATKTAPPPRKNPPRKPSGNGTGPTNPLGNPKRSVFGWSEAWTLSDRIGLIVCWIMGILFCLIAAAIVIYMFVQGLKYVSLSFITTPPSAGFSQADSGGALDAIIGTGLVAAIGIAIALPLGVAIAVWLSEYGRPFALARIVESTVEMMAGTPSIVLALFGTVIFTNSALAWASRSSGGAVFGRSFIAAGFMLSLVALPLIVASTREGLQAIPRHIREASYAAGKTKIATTRRILLPAARPSVATGTMLGLGRIIGDTAIIVILLGATLNLEKTDSAFPFNILQGAGSTLTSYVYSNSPTGDGNQPQKAYAAAFVLLLFVLILNACADVVHRRARKAGSWHS
jgi:phosphate transport system permease protein